jgi:hypothetical protein
MKAVERTGMGAQIAVADEVRPESKAARAAIAADMGASLLVIFNGLRLLGSRAGRKP